MKRTRHGIAALLVAFASALPAHSAASEIDGGWYFGADVGRSNIALEKQTNVLDEDYSDRAIAVHGGYRFTRHIAIEGTYADLGESTYTLDICEGICIPEQTTLDVQQSGKRLDLSLVGSLPLSEKFEVYARAGVARTEFDTVARSLLSTSKTDSSEIAALLGVGMRVHFDAPWSLRLQWDRGRFSEDAELEVDVLWLGVEHRFGDLPR